MEIPTATSTPSEQEIPKEFRQILKDFLRDFFTTFPEYKQEADPLLLAVLETDNSPIDSIYDHVKNVYPERFFDILYKNVDIFTDEDKNTEFLPGIDFSNIWKLDDISDTTRETIWKYLQLIMFSILETIQSQETFGDTAKLFEAINEDELKSKIEETVEQMKGLFEGVNMEDGPNLGDGINLEDLPNPESVHEHLNGLMDGKLGKLAAEIAEETAKDFEMDMNESGDVGDMFKKLFRNPGKLMGLVNTISTKLDSKMKSGDIKESDLMKEATDLMSKMKNMPGMPNIEELMKNMNVPRNKQGMMKQRFNQDMRNNSTKSRLQRKLEERQAAKAAINNQLGNPDDLLKQAIDFQKSLQPESANSNVNFDGKTFSDGTNVKRSKVKKGKKGKKK